MTQYLIDQVSDPIDRLVHQVEASGPVEVIREGKLVAVLLSAEDYQRTYRPKKTFGESILEFRKEYGLDDREETEEDREFDAFMSTVRDKSPGRKVEL